MLADTLVILIYITLIIFIITLIVLCIKLMGTLERVDHLISNITRKAESLDSLFEMIDATTSKFGMIGNTITSHISGLVSKLFSKKKKIKKEKEISYE